jgi:hypothetical protein
VNAVPDRAFYVNADPDLALKINADPESVKTFKTKFSKRR